MNGGVALVVEVDPQRIERRLATRYVDERRADLDDALAPRRRGGSATASARSIALEGNAADVLPELVRRGVTPDVVTDQTSAHDALNGYVPARHVARRSGDAARASTRTSTSRGRWQSMAEHVRAMLALQRRGAVTFDYGNNIRAQAEKAGVADAFDIPGLRARVHPAAVLRGQGTVPLGGAVGRSGRHRRHRRARARDVRRRRGAVPLDPAGARARRVPGPAGADLLARLRRARAVRPGASTIWSAAAWCRRPIVIGRDHLDTGSVASPNRETEGMRDGSDAIADWPVLNALLNTSSGATWVSVHHGGGVGIGYSLHAGMVVVADGIAARRTRNCSAC